MSHHHPTSTPTRPLELVHDGRAPAPGDGSADAPESPPWAQNSASRSEAVLDGIAERDVWRPAPVGNAATSGRVAVPGLTRQPAASLLSRLRRGASAPLGIGVAVFVVAVAIAVLVTLLRSGATLPESPGAAESETTGRGGGSAGPEGAGGEHSGASPDTPGSAAAGAGDAPGTQVLVHVVGAVAAPGVVELAAGARVTEAIAAAGGATDTAELAGVNLARVVADGEQIVVPEAGAADTAAGESSAQQAAPGGVGGPRISLSQASSAELETLPRVGPALAERIIEWRTAHGPFTSVDALLDVPGIGAKTLEGFRDSVVP